MEQTQAQKLAEILKTPLVEMTVDELHEVRDEVSDAVDNIRHQMEMAQINRERDDDFDAIWYSKAKRALQNYVLRNRQIGREIRKRHATSPKAIFLSLFINVVKESVPSGDYQRYVSETEARVLKQQEVQKENKPDDPNDYVGYLDQDTLLDK